MAFNLIRRLMGKSRRAAWEYRTASPVTQTEGSGVFEIVCVCAVTDRPYVLQYERIQGGKLRFRKAITEIEQSTSNRGANGAAPNVAEVPVQLFETAECPCAWCGTNGFVLCSTCGELVCGGRSSGDRFQCRRSCGASFETEPMESVPGRNGTQAPPPAPAAASGPRATAKPVTKPAVPAATRSAVTPAAGKALAKR